MDELAGRQFGPYRVVEPLGRGGMATVYKAFQPAVNRHVALKVLASYFSSDEQFLRRFRHEAAVLAQLQHPHILPVFDFGEADGYLFLVMPFIDGGTLAQTMKGKPLAPELVARVIGQVSDALDYAHSRGIVHRDIKPSNILIDSRGNCLLADFGIARMAEGTTHITSTGAIIGTPQYMSPEQASGELVSPASDMYSLGVVLYETLTGRLPFEADTPIAVAIKHVNAPLPPPRSVNPLLTTQLEAVILKAMARAPQDRYGSAVDLSAALTSAVDAMRRSPQEPTIQPDTRVATPAQATIPAPQPHSVAGPPAMPTVRQDTAQSTARSAMPWVWSAAAAAVLIAGLVFLFTRSNGRAPEPGPGGPSAVAEPAQSNPQEPAANTAEPAKTNPAATPVDVPKASDPVTTNAKQPAVVDAPGGAGRATPARGDAKPPSSGNTVADARARTTPALVETDAACVVTIDGRDPFELNANETRTLQLEPGEHLVRAVSKANQTIVWRKTIEVTSGAQRAVLIELRSLIAQSEAEARKSQPEEPRAAKEAKAEPPPPPPAEPPFAGMAWMNIAQFTRELDRQKNRGLPMYVEGRNSGGETQLRIHFTPNSSNRRWLVGYTMSKEEYDERDRTLKSQGFIAVTEYKPFPQTFTDRAGVTRYQVIWLGPLPKTSR